MNPEKMRSEYGKLIYMLMDAQSNEVKEGIGITCVKPICTVYSFFEEKGALNILQDKIAVEATMEIKDDKTRSRDLIQQDIKRKENAQKYLSEKYKNNNLTPDQIKNCLYAISDNSNYLAFNRDPVDIMILYLKKYFSPSNIEPGFSLAIEYGENGSRLTHQHDRQYYFVLQSLTLWREILHDMFKLWYIAEEDLLQAENVYDLKDTGQVFHRIQPSPKLYKAISKIVHKTQKKLGNWVSSSVIHLGDKSVPNALMFIDKYTQVPRILSPIVLTIKKIEGLTENNILAKYIDDTFGGVEKLKKEILCDFFSHGFDGSGSDNFFDSGGCIDGRLTSAWNWCSQIEQKKYFTIFKLTGFTGFDGDWQK